MQTHSDWFTGGKPRWGEQRSTLGENRIQINGYPNVQLQYCYVSCSSKVTSFPIRNYCKLSFSTPSSITFSRWCTVMTKIQEYDLESVKILTRTNWYRQEVPFFLGHGLRKIDWELNHEKYIRINFNTYLECQKTRTVFILNTNIEFLRLKML